jgi:hypothetical protein
MYSLLPLLLQVTCRDFRGSGTTRSITRKRKTDLLSRSTEAKTCYNVALGRNYSSSFGRSLHSSCSITNTLCITSSSCA